MGRKPLSPEQREKRRAYLKGWHEVHRKERHAQSREEDRAKGAVVVAGNRQVGSDCEEAEAEEQICPRSGWTPSITEA
jgi:hypothetical protein